MGDGDVQVSKEKAGQRVNTKLHKNSGFVYGRSVSVKSPSSKSKETPLW